jgi:hypothetical protein
MYSISLPVISPLMVRDLPMEACSLLALDGVGLGRCATGSGSGADVCGRIGSEGEVGLVPGWFGFHIAFINPFYCYIRPSANAPSIVPGIIYCRAALRFYLKSRGGMATRASRTVLSSYSNFTGSNAK